MMAVEVAMEDDLFLADLNRQISLLINDDDVDDPVSHFPSFSHQGFSQSTITHPPMLPSHFLYQENCRRSEISKGTGVFIPQSSQPRRRYKQQGKRAASYSAKANNNKQLNNSKGRSNNGVAQTNFSPAYATNYINRY